MPGATLPVECLVDRPISDLFVLRPSKPGERDVETLNIQTIEKARFLIEKEEHWCRGTLAVDARGNAACPTDAPARRRCVLGAIIAAVREFTNDSRKAYDLAISIVRSFRGTTTLGNVNDVRGHAAVLAVLDEAIAVLGGIKW